MVEEKKHDPRLHKISKKRIVPLIALTLVAVGGVATTIAVTATHARETEHLCAEAVKSAAVVQKDITAAVTAADDALASVEVTTLPDGAGESTRYADRVAVDDTRKAGADFITDVTKTQDEVAKVKLATECSDRETATKLVEDTKKVKAQVVELKGSTEDLTADFAVFQQDETTRIAAEKKAAEEAAAAEAERIAAEQAAAAAQQAAPQQSSGYVGGYTGGTGYSGSRGYTPAPAPAPAPAPHYNYDGGAESGGQIVFPDWGPSSCDYHCYG